MIVWIGKQEDDIDCFNLFEKTMTAVTDEIKETPGTKYTDVYKLDIDTSDMFHLIKNVTGQVVGRDEYLGTVKSHYKVEYGFDAPLSHQDPKFVKQPL